MKSVDKPVKTKLHGYDAMVNCGFSYPLVARLHRQFNNPLVELVHEVYQQKGRPITLVDIGAAVGDTVFLLHSNFKEAFDKIICIDGDREFFGYLKQNMQQFPFVETVAALLSDKSQIEKSLVRTHAGTASAQGDEEVRSITLDEVISQRGVSKVDVLKIDTDGFDGKVLKGATRILSEMKPAVIFEWHPILLNKTGNSATEPFVLLRDKGYEKFVFYTKYGSFSHFMFDVNIAELDALAKICLNGKHVGDWHYDVIAISGNELDEISLAECAFAKQKTSAY